MAQSVQLAAEQTNQPMSLGRLILVVAVLSVLAVALGGAVGWTLVSTVERAIEEKQKEAQKKDENPLIYSGNLVLKAVPPVVTNLRNSDDLWIRIECAIIFTNGALPNPDVVIADLRQDILAYLRTLSIEQVQGPSGLQHLREDLNERAMIRTQGKIRELVIETFVIQ